MNPIKIQLILFIYIYTKKNEKEDKPFIDNPITHTQYQKNPTHQELWIPFFYFFYFLILNKPQENLKTGVLKTVKGRKSNLWTPTEPEVKICAVFGQSMQKVDQIWGKLR